MEPVVGIEPTTYGLRNRCSATELHWLALCLPVRLYDDEEPLQATLRTSNCVRSSGRANSEFVPSTASWLPRGAIQANTGGIRMVGWLISRNLLAAEPGTLSTGRQCLRGSGRLDARSYGPTGSGIRSFRLLS